MSVVIFADADDPDTQFLDTQFCSGNEVTYIRWGLSTDDYDLDADGAGWRLDVGGDRITSADLDCADRVVFRRWRSSPPTSAVRATSRTAARIAPFVERQWESALLGLLHLSYRQRPQVWSRDPLRVDNKAVTLSVLSEVVPVPPYIVSTYVPTMAPALVLKSIATDQSVGENERVTTLQVGTRDGGRREPCPAVLQRLIECDREARIGYAFGRTAVIRQRKVHAATTDIRTATADRTPWHTTLFDRDARAVAGALGLEMFTADVLVDHDDVAWWIDVNPDGLFGVYDTGHMADLLRDCFSSHVDTAAKG